MLRPLALALAVLGVSASTARGQGITVQVEPPRLPAEEGHSATVTVTVDVAAAPPSTAAVKPSREAQQARFTVGVTSGTVTPSSFALDPQGSRVTGRVTLEYKTSKLAQPGEVQISVEGGQGMRAFGVGHEGSTNYRGLGRISLMPVVGSGPPQRPTAPPFDPTAGAVNPTPAMVRRGASIALVLAAAAGATWLSKRKGKKQVETNAPAKPVRPAPPAPRREPPRPEPTLDVTLEAGPTLVPGDASATTTLRATFAWGPGSSGEILDARFTADRPGYRIEGSGISGDEIERTVTVPWEWATVDVVFRITVQAQPAGAAPGPPLTRTAECVVRVAGADPTLVLDDPPPDVVVATGRNHVTLKGKLWLFAEPAEGEVIRLEPIIGVVGKREWSARADAPPEDGTGTWRPPFLLQEPGHAEVVRLTVGASWIGGERLARAPRPIPPIAPSWCEISVQGCSATFEVDAACKRFLPVPGTAFSGRGRIVSAGKSGEGYDVSEARIRASVRDLSQGKPGELAGCKIPPRSPIDVDLLGRISGPTPDEKAGALLDSLLSETRPVATTDALAVGKGGEIASPGADGGAIRLWSYELKAGQEPIHDGLVVAALTLDDGFGGVLEVRDRAVAELGSLVFETGGTEFRIHESDLHCFEVVHVPPDLPGKGPAADDSQVRFRWEFALVDKNGEPVCSAGVRDDVAPKRDAPGGSFMLVLGHTVRDRDYYARSSDAALKRFEPFEPQVRSLPRDRTARDATSDLALQRWRKVDDEELATSLFFRRVWREVARGRREDTLLFVDTEASRDYRTETAEAWKDTALTLAARVEMRDRHGYLVATSDRLAAAGRGRTPRELVWRDHTFRYVLATFRCRLSDLRGDSYSRCRYRLRFGSEVQEGSPGTRGELELERPVPADAQDGILELFSADGATGNPISTFSLRLDLEPPDTVAGQAARLDNLGLFVGADGDGSGGERFGRAWLRFLELTKLDLDPAQHVVVEGGAHLPRVASPVTDEKAVEKLEVVHDWYGLGQLPKPDEPAVGDRRPRATAYPVNRATARRALTPEEERDRVAAEAPAILTRRVAHVALSKPNALRVACDPKRGSAQDWFETGAHDAGKPMGRVTAGNEVLYLIDAEETFGAMVDAIDAAGGPGDFVYALGWWLSPDFPLIAGRADTTMRELLARASARGAQVRAMLFSTLKPELDKPITEHALLPALTRWTADKAVSLVQLLAVAQTKLSAGELFAFPAPRMQWQIMNVVNLLAVLRINELPTGAAVLDRRVLLSGSHHQKILLVGAGGRLTGFCGGVDVNPDRLHPRCAAPREHAPPQCNNPNHDGDTAGAPFHDVHCRIRGPAAYDLLRIFVDRWRDHPDTRGPPVTSFGRDPAKIGEEMSKPLLGRELLMGGAPPAAPPAQPGGARHHVQIGRTFGNGQGMRGTMFRSPLLSGASAHVAGAFSPDASTPPPAPTGYEFAPVGERTARQMIKTAIERARRFIYVEDQYLVSPDAREWLLAALPRIHHLTCLIPDSTITSMGGCTSERRRMFLEPLLAAAPHKVRVFILRDPGEPHTYVHTKTWVVDDQFAIIGSANCNTRSYTHDSEVVAGIFDESSDARSTYHFAHQLRVTLWAEHLNLETPEGRAELADGVASAALWLRPPPGARIAPYDLDAGDVQEDRQNWDHVIDPNGA